MPDFAFGTGITGAVRGIIALVVSIVNYVRVSAMKAFDSRLGLQQSYDNLDVVLSGIKGYLDLVIQSHTRELAGTGRYQSGEISYPRSRHDLFVSNITRVQLIPFGGEQSLRHR
jgi:hypothetical protein